MSSYCLRFLCISKHFIVFHWFRLISSYFCRCPRSCFAFFYISSGFFVFPSILSYFCRLLYISLYSNRFHSISTDFVRFLLILLISSYLVWFLCISIDFLMFPSISSYLFVFPFDFFPTFVIRFWSRPRSNHSVLRRVACSLHKIRRVSRCFSFVLEAALAQTIVFYDVWRAACIKYVAFPDVFHSFLRPPSLKPSCFTATGKCFHLENPFLEG